MALTPISTNVEFVQDNVPSTAADGDSWLDTSLSPPRLKVFDSSAGAFVEPRSIRNLDTKVSSAGVDWSSKTPKATRGSSSSPANIISVSGSGYLLGLSAISDDSGRVKVNVKIDGTVVMGDTVFGGASGQGSGFAYVPMIHRFESSFTVENPFSFTIKATTSYVLD